MRDVMTALWNDDAGFNYSWEVILVFTILGLGLVPGLTNMRNAILSEATDVANAIGALNQTYSYCGVSGCCSSVGGSSYTDKVHTFFVITLTSRFSTFSPSLCP